MAESDSLATGAGVGAALGFSAGDFIIDGQRGGAAGDDRPGGGGGGGWSLSRDEAEDAAKEAREIADDYEEQVADAEALKDGQGPPDPASQAFTKVGNNAFAAGADHVKAERDSWMSLADALEKALGTYQQTDEQAGQDVGKSGDQDQSGGGYF